MAEKCGPFLSDIVETCDQPIRVQLEQRLGKLPRSEQLKSILELIQVATDTDERVIEIVAEAWNFLQSRALWDVQFPSLEEMKRAIEFEDSVKHMLERHHIVESRIQAACKGIRERWGGFLPDLLADIAPPRFTRHVVEMLYRLSKMCPLDRAREMLKESIQTRLKAPKTSKHPWVTQADVAKVTKHLDSGSSKRLRSTRENVSGSTQVVTKQPRLRSEGSRATTLGQPSGLRTPATAGPADGMVLQQYSGWVPFSEPCNCPPEFTFINDQNENSDDINLLGKAVEHGMERLCLRHLRGVATSISHLRIPLDREELQQRLHAIYQSYPSFAHLRRSYPEWFSVDAAPQDDIYLHKAIHQTEFDFDSKKVLSRVVDHGEHETWCQRGWLRFENIFDYLEHSGLIKMRQAEFNMIRYHHRSLPNDTQFSLLRNMYYSLFQQVIRMDPVWYALNCALRPDKQWRLITYPDAAIDENPYGAFEALYKDSKFHRSLLSSIIQVPKLTRSVEDEAQRKSTCTVTMAPAHSVIKSELLKALDNDGEIFLFEWYLATPEDHGSLENEDKLSWERVAAAHRDLEAPMVSVCGQRPSLGRPEYRFPGSVMLDSASALGDALVGRRKWSDRQVIRERDILLGPDNILAAQYVNEVRRKLVDNYLKAFQLMKEVEITAYGDSSFFASIGSLS